MNNSVHASFESTLKGYMVQAFKQCRYNFIGRKCNLLQTAPNFDTENIFFQLLPDIANL